MCLVLSVEIPKPVYNIEHAIYYFNDFIGTYNKNYPNEKVKTQRLKIFTDNLEKINQRNFIDSAMYSNIESQYAIRYGSIIDLSEQQLVDCSKVNNKCSGGFMTQCMTDIMESEGIENESDYPYIAAEGSCQFQKNLAKVKLSGCKNYVLPDENQLKQALYKNGPISIALAADAIMSYHGGIVTDCPGPIDHAVLLVGYGSENGQDFWIIKNSWAGSWGEQGYFRISRGKNTCMILNELAASGIVD